MFSLRAFDRVRRKATKAIADASNLPQNTARDALKNLEQAGLVGKYPSAQQKRAIWVGRKVKGKRTTSYQHTQYLSDATHVQSLANTDANAKALLGQTNLAQLNMKDKTHRKLFNSTIDALTQAGHIGLPTYDLVAGSFYWWLTTTSRSAAGKAIQQFKGTGQPP